MTRHARFRWLSYPEWAGTPESPVARACIGGAELLVVILFVAVTLSWWSGFVAPLILVADYVARSVLAHRRSGPSLRSRMPFRFIGYVEWTRRRAERNGLYALVVLTLIALGMGDGTSPIWLAVPLVWPADYVWCCASRSDPQVG